MVKKMDRSEAEDALDLSISFVGTLLSKLADAKRFLRTAPDPMFAAVAIEDALRSSETIKGILKTVQKTYKPGRKSTPKEMKLSRENLVKFNGEYFSYLNPASGDYSEYSSKRAETKEDLCRHLATWVFDDGDTKGALIDVKASFGDEVMKKVKEKLRKREHDT